MRKTLNVIFLAYREWALDVFETVKKHQRSDVHI
jgi:hypothetical protein